MSFDLRAVVFDLDGLMFNTEALWMQVGDALLQRRGLRYSRELADRMMGRPGAAAFQIMIDWHGLSDTIETLQRESDEVFASILADQLAPMPGLLELLAALEQAGLPKAIATSSRRSFVEQVLSPFELAPRFSFILTCEDVTHGKPHPEVYLQAASRFGVSPQQMLVLEDSAVGCQAAVAAGAYVVATPGEHSVGHDFSGAALVAATLADPRIAEALGLKAPRK